MENTLKSKNNSEVIQKSNLEKKAIKGTAESLKTKNSKKKFLYLARSEARLRKRQRRLNF